MKTPNKNIKNEKKEVFSENLCADEVILWVKKVNTLLTTSLSQS